MFNVVLYQPEIPANTGNIIRLCANSGARLHIIQPCAFEFDDARLKRAGLDYHEWADIAFYHALDELPLTDRSRLFALSSKVSRPYHEVAFQAGDYFVFGPETRGLPQTLLADWPETQRLTLPMQPHSRSLNLANTVAIVVYEAWRQNNFLVTA